MTSELTYLYTDGVVEVEKNNNKVVVSFRPFHNNSSEEYVNIIELGEQVTPNQMLQLLVRVPEGTNKEELLDLANKVLLLGEEE